MQYIAGVHMASTELQIALKFYAEFLVARSYARQSVRASCSRIIPPPKANLKAI